MTLTNSDDLTQMIDIYQFEKVGKASMSVVCFTQGSDWTTSSLNFCTRGKYSVEVDKNQKHKMCFLPLMLNKVKDTKKKQDELVDC